jgi:integrase
MPGSIEKRSNGVYRVSLFLGRDANGKRLFFKETIHGTKRDAEQYASRKWLEIQAGEFTRPTNHTLANQFDEWLKSKTGKVAQRTLDDYQQAFNNWIKTPLGDKRLRDLQPEQIQDLLNGLQKKYSPRTVRLVFTLIKSTLAQAIALRRLKSNPMADLRAPAKQRIIQIRTFTPAQARDFLAAVEADPHATLFRLALETGLRPEEYLALRTTDLHWGRAELAVNQVVIFERGGAWHIDHKLKTAKSRRTVPLSDELMRRLAIQRDQRDSLAHAVRDWQEHDLLFPSNAGTPLNRDNLAVRHFKPALRRAKLDPQMRLYDLRHSCCVLLMLAGVNAKVVSERLGHASVAFTLDTYGHLLPTMQESATAAMANLLG